jgi:hypothetical protein
MSTLIFLARRFDPAFVLSNIEPLKMMLTSMESKPASSAAIAKSRSSPGEY